MRVTRSHRSGVSNARSLAVPKREPTRSAHAAINHNDSRFVGCAELRAVRHDLATESVCDPSEATAARDQRRPLSTSTEWRARIHEGGRPAAASQTLAGLSALYLTKSERRSFFLCLVGGNGEKRREQAVAFAAQ